MTCPNCNAETNGKFCEYCGTILPEEVQVVASETVNATIIPNANAPINENQNTNLGNNAGTNNDSFRVANTQTEVCPKCGSSNIIFTPVTETTVNSVTKGKTKGFGCIKSCLGFVLFSVPGVLCGLCGKGKHKSKTTSVSTTKVNTVKTCQNCGWRF
ncbi:MAG: hypothetical protein RR436_06960 [Clostridia bacterium]